MKNRQRAVRGPRRARVWYLALAVAACSQRPEVGRSTLTTHSGEVQELAPQQVAASVAPPPFTSAERTRMTRHALAGTVASPTAELGTRMMTRKLKVPSPPAGATMRFNFDGMHRGWVTSLPYQDLVPTPAFGDGKIYVSGGFGSRRFFALDAYSGELSWALGAPDGGPSAAIYEDGKVIFNAESCTIFVVDAKTGKIIWHKWLGDPLMSQPVTSGKLVLTAHPTKGNARHVFAAFTIASGKKQWATPIPADIIRVPQVAGDSAYFATMDGTAFRVRVRDGKVLWRTNIGATSAMWVHGDRVLVTRRTSGKTIGEQPVVLSRVTGKLVAAGARFAAPYLAGNSRDRKLIHKLRGAWGSVPGGKGHLGLRNVAAGWAFQGSSPSVADGRAYFALGGDLRARDIRTGKEVWRRTYKQAADAQAVSPPAIVGSQLVFGTVDGHIYFSDIDTGMTIRAYAVGEPVLFQPVVAQGWVYFTTAKGRVIGLEVADHKFDGWHMWGGNAQHTGLVATAGQLDPRLIASRARPGQGTLRKVESAAPDGSPRSPAKDGPLPLLHTKVDATVSGFVSRVHVTQSFRNPHKRTIEAVYLFPLPERAAVDDMVMTIGKRTIRAKIQTRAKAKQTYTAAKQAGKHAALLEQQRPNLFVQRVANLAPGQRIDVRISYLQLLPFEDGKYQFVFPMVAPPRFDPRRPNAVLGKPGELRAAAGIGLSVKLAPGMRLGAIASPSHDLAVTRSGAESALVRLVPGKTTPGSLANRDFRLAFAVGGDQPAATVLAHLAAAKDGYFSMYVQPPRLPRITSQREVLVVVDTSSSMKGAPAAQARRIASAVLAGLRPGDTYNLYRFSDRVDALAPRSLPAGERARAAGFIARLRGAGATQVVPAIAAALSAPADPKRTRIVVFVSDGFIANEADVLRVMASKLGHARIYPVGVGSSPNRFLIERMAELGKGTPTYVALSDKPAQVAAAFAKLIDRPVLTDVTIHWGSAGVTDVYPRRLGDLFAGRPLILHGRFARSGTHSVRLSGRRAGRPFTQTLRVKFPAVVTTDHAAHKTLWARAAIRDRMNRMYLRDDATLQAEVTQLGLRHRLVTQWTSLVAVDDAAAKAAVAANPKMTVTPARALPGDPEIRIPAPANARAVTIVLPFGETIQAEYEPLLSVWTGRFLIPRDASDGTYPIYVVISHRDGRVEQLQVWYTVDSSAPLVKLETVGTATPGNTITIRATQVITQADLAQAGLRSRRGVSAARVQLLSDVKRVRGRDASDQPIRFRVAAPGVWEARYRIPDGARGDLRLKVVSVDLAANVRTQHLTIRVNP